MFRLSIDPGLAVPVYKQAAQVIKVEIVSGRLKDVNQLPPIRELANVIKLYPNTVAKGLSGNQAGKGMGKNKNLRLSIKVNTNLTLNRK